MSLSDFHPNCNLIHKFPILERTTVGLENIKIDVHELFREMYNDIMFPRAGYKPHSFYIDIFI